MMEVEFWVEQQSGPALALSQLRPAEGLHSVELRVKPKRLPNLEDDIFDLLVFLRGLRQNQTPTIVLAYAPMLSLLEDRVARIGEIFPAGALPPRGTDVNDDAQKRLWKELGRAGEEEGSGTIRFLPILANSMLFVWNPNALPRPNEAPGPLGATWSLGATSSGEGTTQGWDWFKFEEALHYAFRATGRKPLAMCGSSDGALGYYEWMNFVGGLSNTHSPVFQRDEEQHGWDTPGAERVSVQRHFYSMMRFGRILKTYAHEDFATMDQETQLDLLLQGEAVAGFVWADKLAGLHEDELRKLEIFPPPGNRGIVSGGVAVIPGLNDVQGGRWGRYSTPYVEYVDLVRRVLEWVWEPSGRAQMLENGLFLPDLAKLKNPTDQVPAGTLKEHPRLKLCQVLAETLQREPIYLEGGKKAHRIAPRCSLMVRRFYDRIQNNKETVSRVVEDELKLLDYDLKDLVA